MPYPSGQRFLPRSPVIHELCSEAPRALREDRPVEKTVVTRPEVWPLLRISPCQREGASDLGIVVTFVNVSALKQAQQDLQKAVTRK